MDGSSNYLPVSAPSIGEREIRYVTEAVRSGQISGMGGGFLERFEREVAKHCGSTCGIATSSGTTALHLSVAALGIGPGDEVLVSTLTNMATFFAVLYQGAMPVPVDVDDRTWNLNPELLEDLVTPRTKAILVVHLYGHPADMDPINEFARRHNLYVIEDAAEAHGAAYKGRMVGSLGHAGCFSFYANKVVTTGEGGMVTSSDPSIADRARSLRGLAFGPKQKFMHEAIGFNYRMTNLQAALGCAQMERIEELVAAKRRVARRYSELLGGVEELQLPVEEPYARSVYWMYHILLKGQLVARRDSIMRALQEEGIETRPCFVPYNLQRIFIEKGMTRPELCPVANRISAAGFYLPSSPELSDQQIAFVASRLIRILRTPQCAPSSDGQSAMAFTQEGDSAK